MEPLVLLAASLACVTAVATLLAIRAAVVAPRQAVMERAGRVTQASAPVPSPTTHGGSFWATLLRPLAHLAKPREAEERGRIQKKLVHAGYRGEHALEIFFGAKIAFALLLGGGMLAANALSARPITGARSLAIVLLSVGFYAPNVWVHHREQSRQLDILRSLADTLDLVVTCVEAGLGLDAALDRIGREIQLSAPVLGRELRQTTMEVQAGVPRPEAFRRLAERTGVEELRDLSAMIIQTELFGTPIGRALRTHSSSMRTRRSHMAEEKAATASVKMMVPLVLFILPSLLAIILGPAIVRIITFLAPALAGGSP
jgi:tight adherence protein C